MNDKTNSSKIIGLIGLGYWGKNILRNLYEMEVLHTACDFNEELLSERKGKFPNVKYTTSFDEMLNTAAIRAIAIAAPAALHYKLVKQTLLAGKDVFVEKPLSLTVKDGEELVELAKNEDRILMVGHILQYHPAVIKLKELISDGELGKIQYVYSNRLNIGKLRTEENILWSFAPHDISVMLMLLNEEPVKVSGFGEAYLSHGIYDTTMTTLAFKNGVRGHIFVSWLHPYKEQKLIIVGSKAMAVFDDVSAEKLVIYPHQIKWQDGKVPIAQKADCKIVPLDKGEPLKNEFTHFFECIETRKNPITDGEEGLKVLKVLESAEKFLNNNSEEKIDSKKAAYYVHQSSCVDNEVEIGEGSKIWHFSHILKNTKIGKKSVIGQNVTIGPDVSVGDRCKIQNNISIYKGVILEDDVFCGPSCVFTNVYNPRAFIERKHEFLQTLVKKGSTIGANATIVCGVTIGEYSLIGAGAVVKSDVSDYAIVVGVPAKQVAWACKCGVTLKFDNGAAICEYCNNEYALENNKLKIIKER